MDLLNCKKVLAAVHPIEQKWCEQLIELIRIANSCKKGEEYMIIPIIENFRIKWKNDIEIVVKNNKWLNIITFGSVRKHLTYFYKYEMGNIDKLMKSKNI